MLFYVLHTLNYDNKKKNINKMATLKSYNTIFIRTTIMFK